MSNHNQAVRFVKYALTRIEQDFPTLSLLNETDIINLINKRPNDDMERVFLESTLAVLVAAWGMDDNNPFESVRARGLDYELLRQHGADQLEATGQLPSGNLGQFILGVLRGDIARPKRARGLKTEQQVTADLKRLILVLVARKCCVPLSRAANSTGTHNAIGIVSEVYQGTGNRFCTIQRLTKQRWCRHLFKI